MLAESTDKRAKEIRTMVSRPDATARVPEVVINEPAVVGSVVAAFERYETALLANDLDALDRFMA